MAESVCAACHQYPASVILRHKGACWEIDDVQVKQPRACAVRKLLCGCDYSEAEAGLSMRRRLVDLILRVSFLMIAGKAVIIVSNGHNASIVLVS